MLITFASQLFGLLKDVVLAYFYGASAITDIFLLSLTITTVLFSLIGVGTSTSFVPYFRKVEKEYGSLETNKFTASLYNLLNVVITLVVILGFIFTDQIVKGFAMGFTHSMVQEAVIFTRISLLGGYSTVVILLFNAYLRLNDQFLMPAINTIIPHIFLIIFIYLSTIFNIYFIVIGVVIGLFVQYLSLLFSAFKRGFRFNKKLYYKDGITKNMVYNSLPVMLSDLFRQLNVVVDKSLASQVVIGGISSLNYASKINGFVQGIFVLSIANIMYPKISKMVANKEIEKMKSEVSRVISLIIFFVMPATIGSMILAKPLVELLFGRGAFTEEDVNMTATVLFYYSIGMIGFSLREIILRIFYSLHDTKTPMTNTIITVFINILLSITLSKFMGIGGLALATSITGILSMLFLFSRLIKKIGSFNFKKIANSIFKISIASFIMGTVIHIIFSSLILSFGNNFSIIFSLVVGIITYLILGMIFKLKEVDFLIKIVLRKMNKYN